MGDDREVIVFDAAHDAAAITAAVNGRRVRSIVLTHGHNDHINAAVPLRDAVDAPIVPAPVPTACCGTSCGRAESPDRDLEPGAVIGVGGHELGVLHTPGHSPGCCCFHDVTSGVLFSGDTLFCGGPGATGRSYSDEPTILRSIRDTLLAACPTRRSCTPGATATRRRIGAERDRVLARRSPNSASDRPDASRVGSSAEL